MAQLVAPAGSASGLASRPPGALTGAVNLAAITTAADRHLDTAARTKEQSRRDGVVLISSTGPRMTAAAKAAILPRHACPGTVWRTVPKRNLAVGLGTVLAADGAVLAPSAPAISIRIRHRYPTLALTAGA